MSRTEGIEYASDDIPSAVENVAKVREVLKDPKPYGRIKDLQPLMDPVEDDMKKLLGIRRNEFLCRIESDLQDLQAQAESQKGFVNQAKDAIADAGAKYESFKNRAHSAQSLNELSVAATNWANWLSAATNGMYDAVDAARIRMDNERRTTEVTSTGEVVKKISNKAVASSAAPIWPSRVVSCPQRTWSATWTTCAPALCKHSLQTTRFVSTSPQSHWRQSAHRWLMAFRKAHQP